MSQMALDGTLVEAFGQSRDAPAAAEEDTAALSPPPMVALRDTPPDWLRGALDQIDALVELAANWDSYGAATVDERSVLVARDILKYLSAIQNIGCPTVTATPNGDVGFCWDAGHCSLDVSVDPTGLIRYVFLDESNPENDREASTRDESQLVPLLTRW